MNRSVTISILSELCRKTAVISLFLFTLAFTTYAQTDRRKTIEGKVKELKTNRPVSYALIYNKTTDKGTVSNPDGYFKIVIRDHNDEIYVSIIGFERKKICLHKEDDFYIVPLTESYNRLSEVSVKARDFTLYNLVSQCRRNASLRTKYAKAYFEMKSFLGAEQIELMESFYNVRLTGADIEEFYTKNSRFALAPSHERVFQSAGNTKALTYSYTFRINEYFPISPLNLSRSQLLKFYFLRLEAKYLNEEQDSVYVIRFTPVDTSTRSFFHGKLWINKTAQQIIKINLKINSAEQHPFFAVFKERDSIDKVHFDITKTFLKQEGDIFLKHMDLTYTIEYIDKGEANKKYSILTNALLYVYSYDHLFSIPEVCRKLKSRNDYTIASAIPYNEFFWNFHDEYSLNDSLKRNISFFQNPKHLTSLNDHFEDQVFLNQYREDFYTNQTHKYHHTSLIHWKQDKRTHFRRYPETPNWKASSLPMHLDFYIFMDINHYRDSFHIHTGTLFDPYTSFYTLPLSQHGHTYLNILFDLMEIERRLFLKKALSLKGDIRKIEALYEETMEKVKLTQRRYMESTDLTSWNRIVFRNLGIDNKKIFKDKE